MELFHVERVELMNEVLENEGVASIPQVIELFSVYQDCLIDWNQKINLVSRRDENRLVTRHFLECVGLIKAVSFPGGARIMDLGSGAGFPGIPLKIVRRDLNMVLVESKRKKVLFLHRVVDLLGLENMDIAQGRAEDLAWELGPFDVVISRSVTDLTTLARWSRPYLQENSGRLVVVKGPEVDPELKRLKSMTPKLGFREVELKPYDPYPQLFRLKKSVIVSIAW